MKLLLGTFLTTMALLLQAESKSVTENRVKRHAESIANFFTDVSALENGTDLIIVLDRSTGMGKDRFYLKMKEIMHTILLQYTVIHPDHVRVAFITFAKDSEIVFDYISSGSTSKSELFPNRDYKEGDDWFKVVFIDDPKRAPGTNIPAALDDAKSILNQGRTNRPGVKQVVLIMTDGDYTDDEDPVEEYSQLHQDNVEIYGIGIGNWLKPGSIRIICSKPLYYGGFEDWREQTVNITRTYSAGTPPLWEQVSMDLCNSGAGCQPRALCYGDAYSGRTKCLCMAGYSHDSNTDQCNVCAKDSYKGSFGNDPCLKCPSGSETPGPGADNKEQCVCPSGDTCIDHCQNTPCSGNSWCSDTGSGSECICKEGWSGENCDINEDNCQAATCENGGSCLDSVGDYTCICKWGFIGKNCQIDIDNCNVPPICENDAVCEDGPNKFKCNCKENYYGMFCQDERTTTTVQTTTTTTTILTSSTASTTTTRVVPRTTTSSTSPTATLVSNADSKSNDGNGDGDMMMTVIVPAIAGGVLLIIIVVIILVVVLTRRSKKEEKKEETIDNNKIVLRPSSTKFTPKTISAAFNGFWKRKTMRGNSFYGRSGAPSAPPIHTPDLLDANPEETNEAVNVVEEACYSNQQIVEGTMDGWVNYLKDLESAAIITRGCITKIDGKKKATSLEYEYKHDEIKRIANLLDSGEDNVPASIQRGEYHITENNGDVAIGKTIGSISSEAIALGRTKLFVIVAIGDINGDGTDKIRKQVQFIVDHINGEGY